MFQSFFLRMNNFANLMSMFKSYSNTEQSNTTTAVAPGHPDAKEEPKQQPPHMAEASSDEVRTEHLFKHPLEYTRTLWYLENDGTKPWEDMQDEISSFDTVEDFWSLYNHINLPSEIKLDSDFSLLKKGIRPMWEDAANKQGGRWKIIGIHSIGCSTTMWKSEFIK